MKSPLQETTALPPLVAPLAGAWIEIYEKYKPAQKLIVAPLAGAWIEMPSVLDAHLPDVVAPLAGAWIEISSAFRSASSFSRRSPRGSVD